MIFSSYIWLLLLLLALLPWVGPWRGKNVVQNLLRSLAFILLALAMCRPHLLKQDAPSQRVLVLDASGSSQLPASGQLQPQLNDFAALGSKKNTHLVIAGGDAALSSQLAANFASVSQVANRAQGPSPLSAALDQAALLIPRQAKGSVTVVTDGLATRPDDGRAILALATASIPVHVSQQSPLPTDARPIHLKPIGPVRVGHVSKVDATIVGLGGGVAGTVQLRIDEKVVAEGSYSGAQREVVSLSFEPQQPGFVTGEVVLKADDQETSLPVTLGVLPPVRILYLGGLQQDAAQNLTQLLGAGFDVQPVDGSDTEKFQKTLQMADLVMLDDVSADSIPEAAEKELVSAVRDEGLGMMMSGGRGGFGSGGWHDRPVEAMLPVELVQKEEKRDPSTSLVLVIDTSGSMGGVRVQLAKAVARLAMKRLLPHDKVGIVEFFGAKRWAAPLQPASNAIELQRALNRMDAGGGTVILPALEEAFYGLQNVDTRYKHVLVLTDGGVEAGDFESLMRRMANEGINVSTVLTGGGYHSEFLVNIANWGKGRFYNVPNRFNLPEIMLKQPSTSRLPAYRPGSHSVRARGGSGWWGDVTTDSIPQLTGYVETKPRAGSEVLLETKDNAHPILSTWRYGLGRVTAFTTEPVGDGTTDWKSWPDYGRALARILDRSAADGRDAFRFEVDYDGDEFVLHAIRQRPRTGENDPQPVASIDDDGQPGRQLKFVGLSPDRFVAKGMLPPVGETIRVVAASSTSPERKLPIVIESSVVAETHVDPAGKLDLAAMAAATGGESLSADDWSAPVPKPGGPVLIPLASWFFGAALLVFLFELVWRRLPNNSGSAVAG